MIILKVHFKNFNQRVTAISDLSKLSVSVKMNEDFYWTGKFKENCRNQSTEVRVQLNQLFFWDFGKPFEYSDASHSQFNQSQASILTEGFEFDAYVSNLAQCRNVNYIFNLESITDRKSETAIPRDIDVSRVRQNYRDSTNTPVNHV